MVSILGLSPTKLSRVSTSRETSPRRDARQIYLPSLSRTLSLSHPPTFPLLPTGYLARGQLIRRHVYVYVFFLPNNKFCNPLSNAI